MDVLTPTVAMQRLLDAIEAEVAARRRAAADPSKVDAHLASLEKLGAAKANAKASLRFSAEFA